MANLPIVSIDNKIPYQASKWLKVQVLLDAEEFANLIDGVDAHLYEMEGELLPAAAKLRYATYAEALKEGKNPPAESFAWMWTKRLESLYLLDTGRGTQVRIKEPLVQISHHQMGFTPEDKTFRSNLFGPEAISWGLQFSFPTLFQDPDTKDIFKVNDPAQFQNLELFKYVQRWLREHSMPTPFEEVNAPQRIGKKALAWVNEHPHLKRKKLKIKL